MQLRYSDVTPRTRYFSRRRFLSGLGAAAVARAAALEANRSGALHNPLGDRLPPKKVLTSYNNFYEFGTGKEDPAKNAPLWTPNPEWPVRLEGELLRPRTLGLDDILKLAPLEERIYRLRCVEGWSVVVPWIGLPLSALLRQVEPTSRARWVAFESFYDARLMQSPRQAGIRLPYLEGLRLDEALHPLTLLAVGLYGETLPNQNGAPLRLVVPWKYGFKSIKSIVRIRFTERRPVTTWNLEWPQAYGFYANVNPAVPHPRFDQASEQRLDGSGRLGEGRTIRTELFNGYGAQVGELYRGMDLVREY